MLPCPKLDLPMNLAIVKAELAAIFFAEAWLFRCNARCCGGNACHNAGSLIIKTGLNDVLAFYVFLA